MLDLELFRILDSIGTWLFVVVPCGLLSIAYFLRMTRLQIGLQKAAYVFLHASLGSGCAAVAYRAMVGESLTIPSLCAVSAAVCHLVVTHRPGRQFEPPPYMASDATPFDDFEGTTQQQKHHD